MKRICTSLALVTAFFSLNGQIKVATNNNVGIGTTNPQSLLSVNTDGDSNRTMYVYDSNIERLSVFSLDNSIGSYAISLAANVKMNTASKLVAGNFQAYQAEENQYCSFGLRASAGRGYNGKNYGVWGALVGSRNGAAIVGTLNSEPIIDGKYAGYFDGNVKVTGELWATSYETSDERLKTNIRQISSSASEKNHLNNLLSLSAIKYNLRSPAEYADYSQSDTLTVEDFEPEHMREYYTRERIGLSAQEIQAVYPELVVEDSQGYLGVDYNGLIPILIEAIKEQDAEIELLKKELDQIRQSLKQ